MISEALLDGWRLHPPASTDALQRVASDLGHALPEDYRGFLRAHDGGEGFLGRHYLMLWGADQIARCNREYESALYAPGLTLFGSDGAGHAFGFDTRGRPMLIVRVPFLGLSWQLAKTVAITFDELLVNTAASPLEPFDYNPLRPPGMELMEIEPSLLGGDAKDARNHAWVTRERHTEMVRLWNRVIRELGHLGGLPRPH